MRRLLAPAVLPAAFLVLFQGPVQQAHGPYWVWPHFDPDYQYLLCGLNVASLRPAGPTAHPGITVQVLNGALLRARHLAVGRGDIEDAVLADPEGSLLFLQTAYRLLLAAGLFLLGRFALARTGRLGPALLLQATPALSLPCLVAQGRVSPEIVLLGIDVGIAALLIRAFHGMDRDRPFRAALAWAIPLGLALATKFTAAPLLAIPLILLPGKAPRLAFLGGLAAVFAVAMLPGWSLIPGIVRWMLGLALHQGIHGQGGLGLPGAAALAGNLADALASAPTLAAAALLLAFAILGRTLRPAPAGAAPAAPSRRPAAALLVAFALQLLVVMKHPGLVYLTPAAGLVGAALWIGAETAAPLLRREGTRRGALLAAAFAVAMSWGLGAARPFVAFLGGMAGQREDALAVRERLERMNPDAAVIVSYWGSSPEFAFFFANVSAEGRFTDRLRRKFPNALFYNPGTGRLLGWEGPVDIDAVLRSRPVVLYQGFRFGGERNRRPSPFSPVRELFRRGEEAIYRVGER